MARFKEPYNKNVLQYMDELWKLSEKKENTHGVPVAVRKFLNASFSQIPVSSFPLPDKGKVLEIPSDATIYETVKTLSQNQIFSAPVRDVNSFDPHSWKNHYLGIIDFSTIVLWIIEQAELAAAAISATIATATGIGTGALSSLGAVVLGVTGPAAMIGVTAAAVGASVAGGIAVKHGMGKDPQTAADALGDEFYKALLCDEPFSSTKVSDITHSYRWGPFIPVFKNHSMLTVLLLMSKYRLRSVPVVETGTPHLLNLITQSHVIQQLSECNGYDWFDAIAKHSLTELDLPIMKPEQLICIDADKLVLEAFILMREKDIGGLAVTEGQDRKLFTNISLRDVQYLLLNPGLFHRRKNLSVRDFIATLAEHEEVWTGPGKHASSPVTCSKDDVLKDVIGKLAQHKIHRLHVIDSRGCVIGVVTLRDLISRFVIEPDNYFKEFFNGMFECEKDWETKWKAWS